MKLNSHSGPTPRQEKTFLFAASACQEPDFGDERLPAGLDDLEKFAFTAEKKEHPEEKELDKFMYVFYGGNFVDH